MDSILDPVRHSPLIADMHSVCAKANVLPKFVSTSMVGFCSKAEVDWVVNYNDYKQKYAGLVLEGVANPVDRCQAICGALLRNFIDARMIAMNTIVSTVQKDNVPEPSVMLICDLWVQTHGKSYASWQIQGVYDMLLSRMTKMRPTVVYIQDMKLMEQAFGSVFGDFLSQHYRIVGKGEK